MSLISYADAFANFSEIADMLEDDDCAHSEAWNNYTDSLCKDGEMNGLMYHYCPANDDDMPDSGEMKEFIVDAMGFTMTWNAIEERTNMAHDSWHNDASHYALVIKRGEKEFHCEYSMGSAHVNAPELCDVLENLLDDSASVEGCDFEEFCDNLGFDSDSRKAFAAYELSVKQAEEFSALISGTEAEELREIISEFWR